MNNKIAILLATYNSETYLKEQLDSLFDQSYQNFVLYIRDDGSTDRTKEIVSQFMQYHQNIVMLEDPIIGRGAKGSFLWMLENVEAEFFMFCDHDDVWLDRKVEVTLERMILIEQQLSKQTPIVVNTDLVVVDSELNIISDSMWRYARINPLLLSDYKYLSVYNLVTGCTMMINNAAKKVAFPISGNAIMHDSWISLKVITQNGIISSIKQPMILYRQHSNNVVGVKSVRGNCFIRKLSDIRKVYKENERQLKMLNDISSIGWCKYWYYKLMYLIKR